MSTKSIIAPVATATSKQPSQPANSATSFPVNTNSGTTTTTRKPRKSSAPENETASQKFVRLAVARMTKARKAISQIGNLASANYESTEAQRTKILTDLDAWVEAVQAKFSTTESKQKQQETYSL